MSTVSIPVLKFLFRQDFKVLNDALALSPSYEVEEFPSAIDLATYLSTIPAGLVISSLIEKEDLIQIATLVKTLKKSAPTTAVKIVVINFSGDKQFEKAIAKLGIQDMVEPAVNTKALKFKLDFWMKSLQGQIKNNPNVNLQNKTNEAAKTQEKKAPEVSQLPSWKDPLELEEDIWILKQEADCKKVLSKWLIRLLGPSPYVGQWTDVKNNLWRFDIKSDDKEMYVSGTGAWFYHGEQKPDFVWKENVWLISGENFDLFYKDETQVHSRLKSKDKVLTIAKNSMFAKTKEQIIIESCDKELVFKKGADALNDLEGKGKTDQLNGGPLSGKNKTSYLDRSNLSGEVNPEDALLSTDPLIQKSQTEKQAGHLKGKVSNQDIQKEDHQGPGPEGFRDGEELGLNRNGTDHKKYYKNHNEAEKYEGEAKEHERQGFKQEGSGPLSGKSSTDKLDGFYDNSNSNNEKAPRENKERELAGKSETDKLKSHYDSLLDGAAPESKDSSRASKDYPASIEKESNSKGGTDKLASHYKSETKKENSAPNKDADPYADLFGSSKESKTARPAVPNEIKPDLDFSNSFEEERVISLAKARDERIKQSSVEEMELAEACADAKVTSVLTQNKLKIDCKLDDFFEDTIIMTTNQNVSSSEKVQLDMVFKYLGSETKLLLEANVVSVDDDGEGNNYVSIQVPQVKIGEVDTFMKLYQARQNKVNFFMNKVKGF